jgi:hypothetical protein
MEISKYTAIFFVTYYIHRVEVLGSLQLKYLMYIKF